MSLAIFRRILQSPIAFSPLVLLLQIPWAIVGGSTVSSQSLTHHRLLAPGLAVSYLAVTGINFAFGTWSVRRFGFLAIHRATYTFAIWLLATIEIVAFNQAALNILSIPETFTLKEMLVSTTIVWLVGLASATYVVQSRREYSDAFNGLQTSNLHLARLETIWTDALNAERQDLVSSIDQTITPQLKLISSDLRDMQEGPSRQQYALAGTQIDDLVLPNLRYQIARLGEGTTSTATASEIQEIPTAPRLVLSDLPLDAVRSIKVAIIIGLPVFLSVSGIQRVPLWLLQILAIYSPVFVMQRIARRMTLGRVPSIFWVLLACITVVTLRLTIFAGPTFVTVATSSHTPPVMVGIVYTLSILLASLDKYFVDSYIAAATAQRVTQDLLNSRLATLEATRQATRNGLARVLHGPIQGRLASVRLKLNLLDESASSQGAAWVEESVTEIADILDEITHELEALGDSRALENELTTIDQIALLQRNWMGFITVSYTCSPQAAAMLASDPSLDRKVAAACMEVTTNASRHGDASELVISVELVSEKSILRLIAQDDGSGVQSSVTPGMGLKEIHAEGGEWKFEPCPQGARLCVEFAVKAVAPQHAP